MTGHASRLHFGKRQGDARLGHGQVAAGDARQPADQPQAEIRRPGRRRRRQAAAAGEPTAGTCLIDCRHGRQVARRPPWPRRAHRKTESPAARPAPARARSGACEFRSTVQDEAHWPTRLARIATAICSSRVARSVPLPGRLRSACSLAAKSRSSIADSKQLGLGNDFGRAGPIMAVGRPEQLAVDDLGKTDDRVERCFDLVDQLAQRIGVAEQRMLAIACRIVGAVGFAQGDAAIAGEAAVGRLERRNAADFPCAGKRPFARQRQVARRGTARASRKPARPPRRRLRCPRPGRSTGRSAGRAVPPRPRRFRPTGRIPSETVPERRSQPDTVRLQHG